MIVPTAVDVIEQDRPVCNWILIVFTLICFICQWALPKEIWKPFILNGFTFAGFFGHIFLHGNIPHLIGNLLFLWIFGNAINSKVGNLWYLPLYITMGLIAGFLHTVIEGTPALGASGAINGVVGSYLVIFPLNRMKMRMVNIYLKKEYVYYVKGYIVILYWFAKDIYGAIAGHASIAYFAHIGGFLGGAVLTYILVKKNIFPLDYYDKSLVQIMNSEDSPEEKTNAELVADLASTMNDTKSYAIKRHALHNPRRIEEISVYCSCGEKIKVDTTSAIRTRKCPACSAMITIPRVQ